MQSKNSAKNPEEALWSLRWCVDSYFLKTHDLKLAKTFFYWSRIGIVTWLELFWSLPNAIVILPKPQTWVNTRKTQPTPWNCDATLLLTYVISSVIAVKLQLYSLTDFGNSRKMEVEGVVENPDGAFKMPKKAIKRKIAEAEKVNI